MSSLARHSFGTPLPLGYDGPNAAPTGWVGLRDAFNRFGAAALGKGWLNPQGFALAASVEPFSSFRNRNPSANGFDAISYAQLYARPLAEDFSKAFRVKKLQAAYQGKGGGGLTAVPNDWWQSDDIYLRLRTGAVDPAEPFSTSDDLPCWIFVQASTLEDFCAEISQWRRGLERCDISTDDDGFGKHEMGTCRDGFGVPVFIMGLLDDAAVMGPATLPIPEEPALAIGLTQPTRASGTLAAWVADRAAQNIGWTVAWKEMQELIASGQFAHVSRTMFENEYRKHHPNPKRGPRGDLGRKPGISGDQA